MHQKDSCCRVIPISEITDQTVSGELIEFRDGRYEVSFDAPLKRGQVRETIQRVLAGIEYLFELDMMMFVRNSYIPANQKVTVNYTGKMVGATALTIQRPPYAVGTYQVASGC